MIEERALVIEAGEGWAWVEPQRQSLCRACSANPGCGTATLAKIWGRRRTPLRISTRISLQAGDEVIIALSESALLQGSLAVYVVPLLAMFLGAVVGEWLSAGDDEEWLIILLGIGGLVGGLIGLRSFARGIGADSRLQPLALRRLTPAGSRSDGALLP